MTGYKIEGIDFVQPLRKVIRYEYFGACRYTGYEDKSIRLYLECGHNQARKVSAGVPVKARCRECPAVEIKP